jgi:hypothetical protein
MMRGSLSPGVIARDCSPDFATPAGCWTSGLSGGTREKGGLEGVVNLAGDRGFESPLLQRRVTSEPFCAVFAAGRLARKYISQAVRSVVGRAAERIR